MGFFPLLVLFVAVFVTAVIRARHIESEEQGD